MVSYSVGIVRIRQLVEDCRGITPEIFEGEACSEWINSVGILFRVSSINISAFLCDTTNSFTLFLLFVDDNIEMLQTAINFRIQRNNGVAFYLSVLRLST